MKHPHLTCSQTLEFCDVLTIKPPGTSCLKGSTNEQAIRLAALCLAASLLAGCESHVIDSGYVACEATFHGYYLDHRDLDDMAASLDDYLDRSYADSFIFTLPDFFNLFHACETTRAGNWNIADDRDVVATCTT